MAQNTNYVEVEARWINVDQKTIEVALAKAGATKQAEYFFREWILEKDEWRSDHRRVRVRTDGTTHWLTYKANKTWAVDSTEEVECTVSSPEAALKFVQAVDVPLTRYQEKKMWRYKLNDALIEFSFWPKIPMVVEIEAPGEAAVRQTAELLGLAWDKAIFEDQKVVHSKYFGVDLDKETDYRFAK